MSEQEQTDEQKKREELIKKVKIAGQFIIIWVVAIAIEIAMRRILMVPNKEQPMIYPQNGQQFHSFQNGGAIAIAKFAVRYIHFIIALGLSMSVIFFYMDKTKCRAIAFALLPILPLNRLYTGHFLRLTTIVRIIPVIGNIMDIVLLSITNMLEPKEGWDGTHCFVKGEKILG